MKLDDERWALCNAYGIQQKREEFEWLLSHIKDDADILEIGSYSGGTTVGFCQTSGTVVACDIYPRYNIKMLRADCDKENVHRIKGDSLKSKHLVTAICDKFDAIFIDGDHTYEGVKKDYLHYKDLLAPGGIIAFHDVIDSDNHRNLNCYVALFWEELKLEPTLNLEEKVVEPMHWGGIGIIHGE